MIRFEQVNQEILTEDMTEMLRNNPPDVVYAAFRDAFFQGAIRMFQRDNEMQNIVLTDAEAHDKASGISSTAHFVRCEKASTEAIRFLYPFSTASAAVIQNGGNAYNTG